MSVDEISDDIVDTFRRDGAAVVRGVLRDEWVDALRTGVEHNRRNPSAWSHRYTDPDEAVGFWTDYVTWPGVAEYRRVVFDSGLASIAARLMGSTTARFFHEHVLVKEPGTTERTPWHHDQPYYPVDGDQNVSMWVPLDPVGPDAAVEFLVGSHHWNRWFIPRRFIDHTPYGPESGRYELLPDIDAAVADPASGHRTVSFDTEPGDVVVFHYRTLHAAPGNSSESRRRVVSLRWVGDDARWATRPWQVSPPFEPDGLLPGDPLDDIRFPVAHPRPSTADDDRMSPVS